MPLVTHAANINIIVSERDRQAQTLRQISVNDVRGPKDALTHVCLQRCKCLKASGTSVDTHLEDQAKDDAMDARRSVKPQHGDEKQLDAHHSLERLYRWSLKHRRLETLYCLFIGLED